MVQKPISQNTSRLPDSKKADSLKAKSSRTAILLSQAQHVQAAQNNLQWASKLEQTGLLPNETLSRQEYLDALCSKRMHFLMSSDPILAVREMEDAVLSLTQATQCELFAYDENTGIFTSLSDEKRLGIRPRELNTFSDSYLTTFFNQNLHHSDYGLSNQSGKVFHACLTQQSELIGLVAIYYQPGTMPTLDDCQQVLETVAPYLSIKVSEFRRLKQGLVLPHKQQVLAELSNRLVSAVDKESIIIETLDVLWSRLGFGAGQYVVLSDSMTGYQHQQNNIKETSKRKSEGVVLYEATNGRLKNFFHAGLMSKRHVVKDFANIVSLLSSGWRKQNYLHLSGGQLGDKSLSYVFGVKGVHSALILPVIDVQTGKINATLNVFQTKPIEISPETIDLLLTVMDLVANALGRATVLEKALAMATRDELTGLFNRRGFYERCQAEIDRMQRHPGQLCVALIDVDHFKILNDTYGHLNGDIVLRALADTLLSCVRRTDIVSRFGGEEFAILLPDTSIADATDLLERVRKQISQLSITGINNERLKLTASIGVASVNQATNKMQADMGSQTLISMALSHADIALYDAKSKGRNRTCLG